MPDVPPVIWQGAVNREPMGIISYVCSRRLTLIGYESYLEYICDTRAESSLLNFVPIVCEFPDVFSTDLSSISPNYEIEFAIDLKLRTQPIPMVPNWMAHTKLKELNSQL